MMESNPRRDARAAEETEVLQADGAGECSPALLRLWPRPAVLSWRKTDEGGRSLSSCREESRGKENREERRTEERRGEQRREEQRRAKDDEEMGAVGDVGTTGGVSTSSAFRSDDDEDDIAAANTDIISPRRMGSFL